MAGEIDGHAAKSVGEAVQDWTPGGLAERQAMDKNDWEAVSPLLVGQTGSRCH
jgi:hypothetical protein